jgi:hypothetical protein
LNQATALTAAQENPVRPVEAELVERLKDSGTEQ